MYKGRIIFFSRKTVYHLFIIMQQLLSKLLSHNGNFKIAMIYMMKEKDLEF